MSHPHSLARLATLVASLALFVGNPQSGGGQVPKKPTPPDSAAKAKPAAPQQQGTTRIKISKEKTSGGEVAIAPPCDTVTKFVTITDPVRDDSIRMTQHRLDSIAAAFERRRMQSQMLRRAADAEARVRAEWSAAKEAEARALKLSLSRGFYLGIGGGASTPQRALRDGYAGGYNVTVPIGYDATDLPWGIRVDGSVDHLNGTRLYNQAHETIAASGDITVWSLSTDLKLRLSLPKATTRTHFYTLAGVGVHKVTGGVYGTIDPSSGEDLAFDKTGAKFGWNVGAGAAIAWGPTEVFIESRFMQVKSDMAYRMAGGVGTYTAFTPFVIGLTWF